MDPNDDAFDKWLAECPIAPSRYRAELTLSELAARAGLTLASLARWQGGQTQTPDPDNIRAVAVALKDPSFEATFNAWLSRRPVLMAV